MSDLHQRGFQPTPSRLRWNPSQPYVGQAVRVQLAEPISSEKPRGDQNAAETWEWDVGFSPDWRRVEFDRFDGSSPGDIVDRPAVWIVPTRPGRMRVGPLRLRSTRGERLALGWLDWQVLPLPTQGRPPSFNGGVGSLEKVEVTLEPNPVRPDEPMSFRLVIHGTAALSATQPPDLSRWNQLGIEVEPLEAFQPAADRLEWRATARTSRMGSLRLPPLVVSVFDPAWQRYVTRSSQTLELQVIVPRFDPNRSFASFAGPKRDGPLVLDPTRSASRPSPDGIKPSLIWGLVVGTAGLVLIGLLWRSLRIRSPRQRASRALRLWRERLGQLNSPNQASPTSASLESSTLAEELTKELDRILGIDAAGHPHPATRDLRTRWQQAADALGFDQLAWNQLQALADQLDQVRFGPTPTRPSPSQIIAQALEVFAILSGRSNGTDARRSACQFHCLN
ncbi:hypothetical protein Isop_0908 [Isosphaera pallida ATCC 43644]|uniref:Protein BatD n=1 Tax=Isosphaera pallida (strain ATCC 43644 / DSM 9630 / IS1B) TaxID=575540 RepID=E8R2Z3_ISOPI|nr:BatD family protein [Isosphaera pallida]ADV61497.1 hypothetical protein Isop_0908 [Isosphaera pallida ATCC 43644]